MLPLGEAAADDTAAEIIVDDTVENADDAPDAMDDDDDDDLGGKTPAAGAGAGTIPGFVPRSTAVPVSPTTEESTSPGLDRSMMYHSTGFTSASVREACSVDCHGSLRCRWDVSLLRRGEGEETSDTRWSWRNRNATR